MIGRNKCHPEPVDPCTARVEWGCIFPPFPMNRRRSTPSTIGSCESLAPRTLMSASALVAPLDTGNTAADVRSVLETQPHVVYESGSKQQFWDGVEAGQDINLNDRRQLLSEGPLMPTKEQPVHLAMQFTMEGKRGGITVLTRTDGVTKGRFQNEYDRGLAFTVEYNGASIYLYDPRGGAYIGKAVQFPQYLELGAVYDITVEDSGGEAQLKISRAGETIGAIQGVVPHEPGDFRIVIRKGDEDAAQRLRVDAVRISHGTEAVPKKVPLPVQAGEAATEVAPDARPRVLYGSDTAQQFWKEAEAGQSINLNNSKQYTSRGEMLPTAENPMKMQTQFSMSGNQGLIVVTRSDGVASGRFDNEYQLGLAFTVEYNGMGIYLSDPSGSQYIGTPVRFSPYLEPGKNYDLTVEDSGGEARLAVSYEGKVIGEIQGSIPRAASKGVLILRKQDPGAPQLKTPSVMVMHGYEAVQRATPAPTPDPKAVDAVFSDADAVTALFDEEPALESPAADPDVIFEGLDDRRAFDAFWDARGTKFAQSDAGMRDGTLSVNERVVFLSKESLTASRQTPIIMEMTFMFKQDDDGLVVLTRTDGQVAGDRKEGFQNGLDFSVDKTGAGIHLWRTLNRAPMHRRIGDIARFPQLSQNTEYTVRIEDHGSSVRMRISEGERVIADLSGAVPEEAVGHQIGFMNLGWDKPRGVIVKDLSVTYAGAREAVAAPQEVKLITKDDPRLAQVLSTDYGSNAIGGVERNRLYRDSTFFIGPELLRTLPSRHPLYGKGNGRVDGDIEGDLNVQLAAYQDVVGDALFRGMEVQLAELKGESLQQPMEMLDFVLGTGASGRYMNELASNFRVSMPDKGRILEESRFLLTKNIDRLIANQEAVARQNWKDTHGGETPRAAPTGSRALELNMSRGLKDAMVHTARQIQIGNYSADVRREFESAMVNAGLDPKKIYANAGATQFLAQNTPSTVANITTATEAAMNREVLGENIVITGSVDSMMSREKPTNENTMIVVIYGSNQFPNQQTANQTELPGLDQLVASLKEHYQEVWPVISGENPNGHYVRGVLPDLHIEARSQLIQIEAFIGERVNSNPNLHFVVLVGYSWGGGDVYEVANWLTNESGLKIKIAASVYVDAVTLKAPTEENRFPPGSQSMLNIFQSKQWDSAFLGGGPITGKKEVTPVEINLDAERNSANHDNIDEIAYQHILKFIQEKIIVQQCKN